jgi:polysaccharide biosynthesis/export protein
MMKIKFFLFLALAACCSQATLGQPVPVDGATPRGYLIGPGDVVTVKVLGEPDFNIDAAIVDEDGKIQVPFNEEGIFARCRTEKELRSDVSKYLSKFLRNPQVSVYVKERNSRPPAVVYGEIATPQRVVLSRKATLQELLALSGGIKKEASGMIQITRTQPLMCEDSPEDDWTAVSGNGTGFPSRIYSVGSLQQTNPVIYPGDVINVLTASPIYVVGEVMRPGEQFMPEGGLPLMQAIAMASGTTREAKIKEVKIYRRKQGSPQPDVLSVNYEAIKKGEQKDVTLQPLDIIEVGKAKKSVFEVMLDIATGAVRSGANTLPVRVL